MRMLTLLNVFIIAVLSGAGAASEGDWASDSVLSFSE